MIVLRPSLLLLLLTMLISHRRRLSARYTVIQKQQALQMLS